MAQEYLPAPVSYTHLDVYKRQLQNPAPCGHRAGRCYVLHQRPQSGNSGVFALCLNIRRILQKEQKSGRTATEKEKSPYWLQGCNSKGREETLY